MTDPAVTPGTAATIRRRLRDVTNVASPTPAVLFDDRWFTWGDLNSCGKAVVELLAGLPVRVPVALIARNRPGCVAALVALLVDDRPPILVSSIQPPVAIAASIEAASAGAVVADIDDWTDELRAATAAVGGRGIGLEHENNVLRVIEVVPGDRRRQTPVAASCALIVPTSGTTGPPKLIEISWAQLPVDLDRPVRATSPERPPVIQVLSMATITGVNGVLRALARQRPIALLERLDVKRWAELVHRFNLRRAGLPPAAMRSMLDEGVPREHLSSLEAWVTGSAPVDPALQDQFEDTYGVPVLVAYGATEFGGAVASWDVETHAHWGREKRGSVGRALEGVILRVVDVASGQPVAAAESGLLEVGREVEGDLRWTRTNDVAWIDQDGFVFIEGRADDVIVRGGFKVPLKDLEAVLRTHSDILDVAAVGLPEPRLGQVPAVAVVLRDGTTTTPEGLTQWLRERVAPYKVPVVVGIVTELPYGGSHKVNRPAVRQLLSELDAAVT